MTACERAERIWPILVLCASRRETLTYDLLGKLVGVSAQRLAAPLEPIQAYCVLQTLPPLTAIVVDRTTGAPLDDFIAPADVPRAQAEVYAQDWLGVEPPRADLLFDASEGMVVRRARTGQNIQFRQAAANTPKKPA